MTGCKINVTQAAGADIEREIGLVGTRQAIDEAKRAIWEKVDSMVTSPSMAELDLRANASVEGQRQRLRASPRRQC